MNFSAALLLYLNTEITIIRGNRVPEDFDGIVFDIGRGRYDHHQKDSRVRENGIVYAAFGLLWEELGVEILGKELAQKFDESFVQPLDNNDNTGEKNELASLIGNFNPTWDAEGSNDEAFFQAVSVAGMILENKFDRYRGNERADKRVEEIYERHMQAFHDREKHCEDARILILPEFVPCQKFLSETPIAFVVFPSNRGGYCIQPQKKEYAMNYKCSFPSEWLGLENEELKAVTGLKTANFCHKGGFLMTTGELADAVQACKLSMEQFQEKPVIVSFGGDIEYDELLHQLPKLQAAEIICIDFPDIPELEIQGIYAEAAIEKQEWKSRIKEQVKQILKYKPEAVFVGENLLFKLLLYLIYYDIISLGSRWNAYDQLLPIFFCRHQHRDMLFTQCMYNWICCKQIFSDKNGFWFVFQNLFYLLLDSGFPLLFFHGCLSVKSISRCWCRQKKMGRS